MKALFSVVLLLGSISTFANSDVPVSGEQAIKQILVTIPARQMMGRSQAPGHYCSVSFVQAGAGVLQVTIDDSAVANELEAFLVPEAKVNIDYFEGRGTNGVSYTFNDPKHLARLTFRTFAVGKDFEVTLQTKQQSLTCKCSKRI